MIASLTKKDISRIFRIDREAFGEGGISKEMLESQLKVFPQGFIVSKDNDGKITGYVAVERHKDRIYPPYVHNVDQCHSPDGGLYYLSVITVDKDHRGEGVGSSLLAEVDKLAKQNGIKIIYCPVNKRHPFLRSGVMNFWKKNGYKVKGEVDWEVYSGKTLPSYVFEKIVRNRAR